MLLKGEEHGIFKNYAWLKKSFKVQDRPRDFNVREHVKVTDTASLHTEGSTFKTNSLTKF